jgi:hypothetical protein
MQFRFTTRKKTSPLGCSFDLQPELFRRALASCEFHTSFVTWASGIYDNA